mmetsp:Transcript_27436/g.87930  ORF Transcript_27436/g.87930 Transcript_27436/m.87930 type:complete len:146 (-) Transcript_27436:38-475(-)
MDVKVIEGISSRAAHTPYSHPSIMFASTQVMSAKSSATFGNAKALKAVKAKAVTPVSRGTVAMASADGMVPDMAKRTTMNLLLLGAVGAPALGVLGPYAYLFVPKRCAARLQAGPARVSCAQFAHAITRSGFRGRAGARLQAAPC